MLHIFHDTSLSDPAWKPLPLRGRGFHAGRLMKYHGNIVLASHPCTCALHRQGSQLHTLKLPKFFHFHGDFHQKWHFAHPKISFAHPELPFLAKSMHGKYATIMWFCFNITPYTVQMNHMSINTILLIDQNCQFLVQVESCHAYYPTPGCENQGIWAVVSKAVDTTGPNLHIGYNTLICITVARERTCSWHSCHIWRL